MKKAFTLAEVLITLGIIGIVAAMTLPVLVASYQKQVTVSKLKKVYSVLSQAVNFAVMDGDYSSISYSDGSNEGMKSWYDAIVEPYIKVSKTCIYEEGCWNDGTKLLDGSTPRYDMAKKGIGGNNITFDTVDGFFITIDVWEGSDITSTLGVNTEFQGVVMYIDVNGKTAPNIVGKDIFVLTYTAERGILPAGKNLSDDLVKASCSKSGNGLFCFEHLRRTGWSAKSVL